MKSVKKRTDDAVDIRFGIKPKRSGRNGSGSFGPHACKNSARTKNKLRGVVDVLSFQKKIIGTRLWRRGGGS